VCVAPCHSFPLWTAQLASSDAVAAALSADVVVLDLVSALVEAEAIVDGE
jgi:hypothetical protein